MIGASCANWLDDKEIGREFEVTCLYMRGIALGLDTRSRLAITRLRLWVG